MKRGGRERNTEEILRENWEKRRNWNNSNWKISGDAIFFSFFHNKIPTCVRDEILYNDTKYKVNKEYIY